MLALPLTGWLYVSAGWSVHTDHPLVVPTRYFGLFHVPDLFGLSRADDDVRATTAFTSLKVHWALGLDDVGAGGAARSGGAEASILRPRRGDGAHGSGPAGAVRQEGDTRTTRRAWRRWALG